MYPPVSEQQNTTEYIPDSDSEDSWDEMDGCGNCLDYFCVGPCPNRETFRPWCRKPRAEAEGELREQQKEARRKQRRA